MDRRIFLGTLAGATTATAQRPAPDSYDADGGVVIERAASGKPHAGKVLALIQPHSDDIPIFAAGTAFKLIDEGYTAYLIRVTNDDMAGPGWYAETVTANERDNNALSKVFGCKKAFDLNYNNHMMDNIARSELRQRFIFLFRLLKVDTVMGYDPWGLSLFVTLPVSTFSLTMWLLYLAFVDPDVLHRVVNRMGDGPT